MLYPEQPAAPPPEVPGQPQPDNLQPVPPDPPPAWPTSAPPVGPQSAPPAPTGWPTSAPPVGQPGYPVPYGYPAPPARPRRPPAFFLLIALGAVLAVALVAAVVLGVNAIHHTRQDRDALRTQQQQRSQLDAAAKAKLQNDFKTADFPGKLQKIKDLDKATDSAFSQWSVGSTVYGTLSKALTSCEDAVDAYDRAAGAFPAGMFTAGAPQKINTDNPETDCGRAFTSRI